MYFQKECEGKDSWSSEELIVILKHHGLPTSGTKEILCSRINEYFNNNPLALKELSNSLQVDIVNMLNKDFISCKEKDKELLLKEYKLFNFELSYSINKICCILSNYLEPNTVRVMNALIYKNFEDLEGFYNLLGSENLVIRRDGFKDNDKESILLLYNTIINTKPSYLKDVLDSKKINVSLIKLIKNDNIYNFIRNWSVKYTYFDPIKMTSDIHNDLKLTIKQKNYNLYRGLNFTKKDLQSFFNKDVKSFVEGKSTSKKIKFEKFTSWSTDVNIAKKFVKRLNHNIKKSENMYQVLLYASVKYKNILADIGDFDPNYDQKEVILQPGTYDVYIYFYDTRKNIYVNNGDLFDKYVDI